jgi:DNA-binding transcriptional LysR family regulator
MGWILHPEIQRHKSIIGLDCSWIEMELRQLRYFEAVVRHRHFTRAADELHVAQSALSHQVRKLEGELGVELLHRTTRSVQPSHAGELVARHARSILREAESLADEIKDLRGVVRGRLTVGALLFGGELDIPALLGRFTARYPGVEISLREGSVSRMTAGLRDGSIDMTFALESEPPDEFERLPLSTERLALVLAPGHRLAGADALPVAALHGEPLIAFGDGSSVRRLLDRAFQAADVKPRIALEGTDLALVRALVAEGIGLAILPRTFAELPGPPITLRPLEPELQMTVALWWRRDRHLSPAARAFLEFAGTHAPQKTP